MADYSEKAFINKLSDIACHNDPIDQSLYQTYPERLLPLSTRQRKRLSLAPSHRIWATTIIRMHSMYPMRVTFSKFRESLVDVP